MDVQLQEFAEKAIKYTNVSYCDVRAEQYTTNVIYIKDGNTEYIRTNYNNGIGVRILYGNIWGFCSITNPKSFKEISTKIDDVINGIKHSQDKIELAPIPQNKTKRRFPILKKPDTQNMLKVALECDDIIRDKAKSSISTSSVESSKYFVNSEGSSILQEFTDTIIHMSATAKGSGTTQSIDVTHGGRGGMEQIQNDQTYNLARDITEKSSQLLTARSASEDKSIVVMNPDFVALLTHEILGHPSEADRVLGREMAWAGGAWWSDKLGKKVGSDNLNVFDDPTIKNSLGWYDFDDEGVKSKRTVLIKDGILENHMNSRETASTFDTVPTGNMRATNYTFMPLIRMACTCIGEGDYNTDEIIKEVKDGYYISNMKIPSIDTMRYNWSISCQYAHKIKDGEITELLKDVIVTGTAPEFFESIDACANDFTVRPITNCGKGDPMQLMVMGNGGPTIRGVATVKSVK